VKPACREDGSAGAGDSGIHFYSADGSRGFHDGGGHTQPSSAHYTMEYHGWHLTWDTGASNIHTCLTKGCLIPIWILATAIQDRQKEKPVTLESKCG